MNNPIKLKITGQETPHVIEDFRKPWAELAVQIVVEELNKLKDIVEKENKNSLNNLGGNKKI